MPVTMWYCAVCGRAWPLSVPVCPRDGMLARPETIGRFRLEARIGSGATGEIFRAVDESTGEKVAFKLLFPGFDLLPNFPTAPFHHDHLATVREVGRRNDGSPYVVTDLVAGEPLRRLLEPGPLDTAAAAELGRQLAIALAFLHQQGLLHGDLKPDNVIVERDADGGLHARLVDFGVKQLHGDDSDDGEELHPFTPRYMAPELVIERDGSPATDVYALGCTLYELVSGRTPFEAETLAAVIRGHLEEPPPPLTPDAQETQHALEPLALRCLAKRAEDRPSAAWLVEQLGAIAARLGPAPARAAARTTEDPVPAGGIPPANPIQGGLASPVATAVRVTPAPERQLPTESDIERRLKLTFTLASDGSRLPDLGASQIAATLRQALSCARELEHLVVDARQIDVAAARDLLHALRLASEQLDLWFTRHRRR